MTKNFDLCLSPCVQAPPPLLLVPGMETSIESQVGEDLHWIAVVDMVEPHQRMLMPPTQKYSSRCDVSMY